MKLAEMSINNCLSFSSQGLNDDNILSFDKFNLFIGSNNTGKSNLLKSLEILKVVLSAIHKQGKLKDIQLPSVINLVNYEDWFFAKETSRIISFCYVLMIEQDDEFLAKMIDNHPENQNEKYPALMFLRYLKKGYPKFVKITGSISLKTEGLYVTINTVSIPNDHRNYNKYPLFDREKRMTLVLTKDEIRRSPVWKISEHLDEETWENASGSLQSSIAGFLSNVDTTLQDLFIRLPANRVVIPTGDNIVESLQRLRDGQPEDINLHENITNHIRELLFQGEDTKVRFAYPEDKGKHSMKIQLEQLQLPLSSYGSGVEQMLVLASEVMKNGTHKVVLIEEPEAHLHPALQRQFIKFLTDNEVLLRHQYLIATHSNIFIDEFEKMGGNIFYVCLTKDENDQYKSTKVIPLNVNNEKTLMLDLGVRPSDLRFANGVIVVEGPTDKAVYTDWARKIGYPFEEADLIIIDAEGAGNISKYLSSEVIQKTCFKLLAICDKNAESEIRNKLKEIIPDKDIIVLSKGDLEDYYPRDIVIDFAKSLVEAGGLEPASIPNQINVGETVSILTELKGNDGWKKPLARKVIEEMNEENIDDEIKKILAGISRSILQ